MPCTIDELFTSQKGGAGGSGDMDLTYVVRGSDTLSDVEAIVALTAPATWDFKTQGLSYDVEHVGPSIWIVRVPNGPVGSYSINVYAPAEYTFDISSGTQHTDVSKATIAKYAATGTAPDHKRLIEVNIKQGKMDVKGCDYMVPKYDFGQTKSYSNTFLTTAKRLQWADIVATTNAASFLGMPIGSVIYHGAQGRRQGTDLWTVTHSFSYSPNRTNVVVGDITVASVPGWAYLWVQHEEVEDLANAAIAVKPKYAYVERMYDSGDFTILAL